MISPPTSGDSRAKLVPLPPAYAGTEIRIRIEEIRIEKLSEFV
jgi:hypothetical protein